MQAVNHFEPRLLLALIVRLAGAAPLCSEVRSTNRQMESGGGHEGLVGPGLDDAVKGCWNTDEVWAIRN
jgi:hypothetical protein